MRCNNDSQVHKRKVQLEELGRYSPASPRGIPTAIKPCPDGPITETFYHKSYAEALRFSFQDLTLFRYAAFTGLHVPSASPGWQKVAHQVRPEPLPFLSTR